MNTGSFGYLFKQGLAGIWHNKVMSFASAAILTACLIITGGAGLLAYNIRDVFIEVESQNEMVIFISDDATDEQAATLGNTISSIEHVSEVKFVSRDDGLDSMREYLGDDGYLVDGLQDDNPLPHAYYVTLDSLEYLDAVQKQIQKLSAVDSIAAPTQLADTLSGIEKTLLILGVIIIGILLLASVVVISNTIKLTVFSRRREINIMKYVGATNRFIRFPFAVEGLTLGFIAAVIAFIVILFVYQSFAGMLTGSSVTWIQSSSGSIMSFWDIWYWVLGGFLVCGMLIGSVGSSSAIRKHLQV